MKRAAIIPGKQQTFDVLAVAASVLCLIHCLLLPLLVVLIPTLAAFLTVPEAFHTITFLFAVPTSLLALIAGFRRHREAKPIIVVLPGLGVLAAGALLVETDLAETVLTVTGALLLSIGHALNWRELRR